MTRQEYEAKFATFDQELIDRLIAQITLNINRAGRLYKKLIKNIYEKNNNY
jgi:hypothetical protein